MTALQLDMFAPPPPKYDRGAALRAVHDLADAVNHAMREAGLYAYGGAWDAGLAINPAAPSSHGAGADPVAHALQWPATWHICGHSPDALFVEVRPRTGQRDSATVQAVLAAMGAISDVQLESEEHPAPYHCYGMWRWGDGWLGIEDPEARAA